MKKITGDSVQAFLAGKPYRVRNDEVCVAADGTVVLTLHGNSIAKRTPDGRLYVSAGGYEDRRNRLPISHTTKERLNGLPGVSVCTIRRKLYLNGERWKDQHSWTEVT